MLSDIGQLTEQLVSSGRWTPERALRLVDDIAECGPSWFSGLPLAPAA
jgi:hypothetical protein